VYIGIFISGVFASSKIDSFRPYPYVDTFDFVFLVIQIIWYLVLSYIVFSEVRGETHYIFLIVIQTVRRLLFHYKY